MKKYGKKWRKRQKEKEIRKANMKIGEPYSKLIPISESECICSECRKKFPIEKYKQMESLVDYLSNKGCITDGALISALSEGIEPVYYRRLSETEIEILETVTDEIIMPRHTCIL